MGTEINLFEDCDVALHTISICTGIGGIERGLRIAVPGAFAPILYVERDIDVAAIIAKEIEQRELPDAPIWSDVKTLTDFECSEYLDQVGVDAITGGYPCQPFSVAGKQLGTDDPRHLWPFIAQAIKRYSPSVCFFENVGGHLVCGFQQVCEDLERMDYRVAAGIFTASEVGASHRRERLFILALADSSSERRERQFTDRETKSDDGNIGRSSRTTVVDPEIVGRRSWWTEHAERVKHSITVAGVRIFAPEPTSTDWRDIVERWPELAPAVGNRDCGRLEKHSQSNEQNDSRRKRRRDFVRSGSSEAIESDICHLADGFSRSIKLRALGNAVVPQCAAVAFISLWAALNPTD